MITRRSGIPTCALIEQPSPRRWLDLDNPQWAASNEAVVRGFWHSVAAEYQPPLPAAVVDTAMARADGNLLHAVMHHEHLRGVSAEERRTDRIPIGLVR